MDKLKKKLERRLKRAEQKIEDLKGKDLSEHGKWELGYLEGRATTLDAVIWELEEIEKDREEESR